ncbi:TetR/AcrR family transcriptional regulator [Streptomyces sp. NPDC048182]|uniref:TetR/AcrR family transcriptional regulator n=1 Tax=unclassified Streptomyces TaxID=2593676 RepID=UPI00339FD7E3
MPRVTQAHREARRRQILDAARLCFIRNGFHATSMQDILGESGLSAGAVYGYFSGKDEIIAAIAAYALDDLARAFEEALPSGEPRSLPETLDRLLATVERLHAEQDVARLVLTVWGESLRAPALAAVGVEMFGRLRELLSRSVAEQQARGLLPPELSPEGAAAVLMGTVQGFVLQTALLPDAAPDAFRAQLRALLTDRSGLPQT